jgi:SPP1 family predicted phage head-tail adaptor
MNLNGRPSNPGELRTPVTLKKRTVETMTGGFQKPAYSTLASNVMVKWVNAHGSEAWSAGTLDAVRTATVTLRYRSDVDETCVVVKGSEIYEIVSMDNIQERNEYLELKVKLPKEG